LQARITVAGALEPIHLGWALVGFALRLPIVSHLSQLLVDASGGEPRQYSAAGCNRDIFSGCGVRERTVTSSVGVGDRDR
jgi:hypothetical protein